MKSLVTFDRRLHTNTTRKTIYFIAICVFPERLLYNGNSINIVRNTFIVTKYYKIWVSHFEKMKLVHTILNTETVTNIYRKYHRCK